MNAGLVFDMPIVGSHFWSKFYIQLEIQNMYPLFNFLLKLRIEVVR
jgi:hypothetical protein